MSLESLRYHRGSLSVIDQLLLPHKLQYIEVLNSEDAWQTIRTMQVRGAPLIAIVAALGLAVDVHKRHETNEFKSVQDAADFLIKSMNYLRTSRPTAVNLFRVTDALLELVNTLVADNSVTVDSIVNSYIEAAEKVLADDITDNKAIGDHGAKKILDITGRDRIRVLTICNTGSLATAGYGTALGVVRSLHNMGKLEHVYACETRPYNQGARLTAFEIVQDGLPGTLIGDSMASYLMATKGVDCVVVGADRITANGDTANKIGTYQLAITAKYHNIPFFTAAPTTTLDLSMSSGSLIHIEERPPQELTTIFDQKIAPDGIQVWNPSFDVTPCALIRGVITQYGVAETNKEKSSDGIIDLPEFLKSIGKCPTNTTIAQPTSMPTGYRRMDESKISDYIMGLGKLRDLLDVTDKSTVLSVAEVGDGNLNYVYIITGPSGKKLVIKQALPYVRCVGESWPLTLERATFEYNALTEEYKHAPEYVPQVYHFDQVNAIIVMRFIEAPHIILRKAFIQGLRFSTFADDLSTFMAKTLFNTSALALNGGLFRSKVSQWSTNTAMCALTEKVIFTDPYMVCDMNHWTKPHLDTWAEEIRSDKTLKLAIGIMKSKFLTSTQALLHADLHSGSVMAKEGSTFVIDPEFAFYGPMGFDVGALLSNLLMAYFSQEATNGADYAEWILQQIIKLLELFEQKFLELWNNSVSSNSVGELFHNDIYGKHGDTLSIAQSNFMKSLWRDTLGFTGAKMIRRIVGIAHVADLESIEDLDKRSRCEKRCLSMARALLVDAVQDNTIYADIRELTRRAREYYNSEPPASLAQYFTAAK